jgi:hypothetical protein
MAEPVAETVVRVFGTPPPQSGQWWTIFVCVLVVFSIMIYWAIQRWRLDRDLSLLWLLVRVKLLQRWYLHQKTTVADVFEQMCDAHPRKSCVISADMGNQLTYREVDQLVCIFHVSAMCVRLHSSASLCMIAHELYCFS